MKKNLIILTLSIMLTAVICLTVGLYNGYNAGILEGYRVGYDDGSDQPNEVDKAHLSGFNAGYSEAMKYANENMVFNKCMVE